MALVMNATSVTQHVKVFGKHFTLKAGQIKQFGEDHARFLVTDRSDMGFVSLPDVMEDIEYRGSEDGLKLIAEAKAVGVANRIRKLKGLINNETVSLQQDLDRANLKIDSRKFMNESMVTNMKELVGYQDKAEDEAAKRLKTIENLEEQLKEQ